MIDFTSTAGSSHPCRLTDFRADRDGTDSAGIIYDVMLSAEVRDVPDAEVIDRLIRGAQPYYEAVRDTDARGRLNHSPVEVEGQLRLEHVESGVTVLDALASLTSVALAKGARASHYNVKLRLRGLDATVASYLAEHKDRVLLATWERVVSSQVALPFATPAPVNAVQVVSGRLDDGSYVFGIQTGLADGLVLIDDFGEARELRADQVLSKNIFAPEHGTEGPPLLEVVAPHAERMRAGGVRPSWKYVILGVIEARAVDDLGGGVYKVTAAELSRAVQLALGDVTN